MKGFRPLAVVTVFVLLLGLVFAVVGSGAAARCTKTGTPGRDVLAGGTGRDVLCGRGGGDYLSGNGQGDVLRGGGGRDTLVGGKGPDRFYGMAGSDRLFAVDGSTGDKLDGGPGRDQCFIDDGDRVQGCEVIFRGGSIVSITKLSRAFFGQGNLAEDLIAEATEAPTVTMTPTATVTATVTVTHFTPFPPCTQPPTNPPAPCP